MFLTTKLTFLGVGGWISDPILNYTSFAIFSKSNDWILVEAGEGVYASLRRCGLDLDSKFKGVIISHRHGDHFLGLPTILQIAKHKGFEKINIFSITDVGKALEKLLEISGSLNVLDIVNFKAIDYGSKISIGNEFGIEFIEALHPIPAASIKIYVDDICIVYSGDTVYNPRLIEFAKGCKMLIHEASGYSEEAHRYGHSTYRDAIEIALKSGVKILTLIHFYLYPQPIEIPIDADIAKLKILVPYPCQTIEINNYNPL
uniref:MBL fold metallo-hydrolase n=2 Tax=Ignisphaera aggregans TaxID=334771 RepID=A0A7C5XIQ1_9CREN